MDFARSAGWPERSLDIAVAAVAAAGAAASVYLTGAGPALAALSGAIAGSAAGLAMAVTGREGSAFEPLAAFDWPEFGDDHDALLLDDPLSDAAPDSRVVRLFAPDAALPGALAERIERWLGDARERGVGEAAAQPRDLSGHSAESSPASAAFHAALTDLRRSLR